MGADLALVVEMVDATGWSATTVVGLEDSNYFHRLKFISDLPIPAPVYSQEGRDSLLYAQLGIRCVEDGIPQIGHSRGVPTNASAAANAALAVVGDAYGSPIHFTFDQLATYLRSIERKPERLSEYQRDRAFTLSALPSLRDALEALRPTGRGIRVICWCF